MPYTLTLKTSLSYKRDTEVINTNYSLITSCRCKKGFAHIFFLAVMCTYTCTTDFHFLPLAHTLKMTETTLLYQDRKRFGHPPDLEWAVETNKSSWRNLLCLWCARPLWCVIRNHTSKYVFRSYNRKRISLNIFFFWSTQCHLNLSLIPHTFSEEGFKSTGLISQVI